MVFILETIAPHIIFLMSLEKSRPFNREEIQQKHDLSSSKR